MKKFFPVRIIEQREVTVAIEGETFDEVREKYSNQEDVSYINPRYAHTVSRSVYCAGTAGSFEEMKGRLLCFDENFDLVTAERDEDDNR